MILLLESDAAIPIQASMRSFASRISSFYFASALARVAPTSTARTTVTMKVVSTRTPLSSELG